MIKLWKWLNGNKTIIGTFLLMVLTLDKVQAALDPQIISILQWLIGILTGISFLHHAQKGYFSTKQMIREDKMPKL